MSDTPESDNSMSAQKVDVVLSQSQRELIKGMIRDYLLPGGVGAVVLGGVAGVLFGSIATHVFPSQISADLRETGKAAEAAADKAESATKELLDLKTPLENSVERVNAFLHAESSMPLAIWCPWSGDNSVTFVLVHGPYDKPPYAEGGRGFRYRMAGAGDCVHDIVVNAGSRVITGYDGCDLPAGGLMPACDIGVSLDSIVENGHAFFARTYSVQTE